MLSLGLSACISLTGPAKPFSTPAGIMYCKDQNLSNMLSARSTSTPSFTCKDRCLSKLKGVDIAGAGAMCNAVKSGHDACCCKVESMHSDH